MDNINTINQIIRDNYPRLPDGRPIFKIVWSTSQFEKIRDMTESGIILGIKTVPKYHFCPDRWVLEKWFPTVSDIIVSHEKGHYEPLFVFEDKDCNYLQPNLKVVEVLLWHALYGRSMAKSDFERMQSKIDEDEVEYFENAIGETAFDYIPSMLSSGQAIVVPNNFSSENREKE